MRAIYGSRKYKLGYCHVFAIALHRIFGYQIAIIEDKDREIINDRLHKSWPYIPHVFCVKGGYIIDAAGVRKPITMIHQVGKWPIKHPKIHKIDVRSLYNNGLYVHEFERITKKNLKEAEEFILKHKSRYMA
jgi:hypothetical protein